MMAMDPRVRIEQEGGVAHVRLNRPDKRNGLDFAMFQAIAAAGDKLAADTSVRAVVLSGEGPAFCAGLDFKSFISMGPDAIPKLMIRADGEIANPAQKVAWVWRDLPVPVLAAIHGVAYGGGLQIALGADLRYVTADARLSVMEMRYGLIPDMGASQTLFPLVRPDVARDLVYTARVFDGEEAVKLGIATEVCSDPLARAFEKARVIAEKSPHTIRAAKELFRCAPRLCPADGLRLESDLQTPLLGSPNQVEAVQAALMKRPAEFQDPD